jgi:hypothetical protein
MLTKDLILRCYAKKDGDMWVAVCIDLCLAAQDRSLEVVKDKLEAQIADYIKEAFSEREYTSALIQRKAPLAQQATYYAAWLLRHVHTFKDAFIRVFDCPIPMSPTKAT